jgi:hypothetical protein
MYPVYTPFLPNVRCTSQRCEASLGAPVEEILAAPSHALGEMSLAGELGRYVTTAF